MSKSIVALGALGALCAFPALAAAAPAFPPDNEWHALRCNRTAMSDHYQDQPGALLVRDIVGETSAPAGARVADNDYLYLRLRLDQDPAPNGVVAPYAWGMLFDLDNNLSTYEIAAVVSGIGGSAGTITLHRNTTTTVANSPNDPFDQPPVASYPFAGNARSTVAGGATNGGDADYFLDFAIPWADLRAIGLDRNTVTHVWAATSSVATSFDGDLACHDGTTGGAIRLDVVTPDQTTGDPAEDPDDPGNGSGSGSGTGDGRLEGGGGCSVEGSASSLLVALAAVGLGLRRRRRA